MKLDPVGILLNRDLKIQKKFYFVSGNEESLIEKIKTTIINKYLKQEKASVVKIDTMDSYVDMDSLFDNTKIYLVNNIKGFEEEDLNKIRKKTGVFIFTQENSQKIKKIKNLFTKDNDCCVIDCYQLDNKSKIKILNYFLELSNKKIDQDLYWYLIEKLDNKYAFFENNLNKILELHQKDITFNNINKLLTIDNTGKEKLFFNILKKNKEIVGEYNKKILTTSDVNELYYNIKFFCQLIIESRNEEDYNKKIPIYLFKEKNDLIDIYKRYTHKKKRQLIRLLSSTEKLLRKESGLSLISGLRFVLSIKKITIS